MQDHYGVLGVARSASEADIAHAYRLLMREAHPDVAGPSGEARAATLNHAYDVLHDPAARRDYDRTFPEARPTDPPHAAQRSRPERAPTAAASSPTLLFPSAKRHLWALAGLAAAIVAAFAMIGWTDHSQVDAPARTLITTPAVLGFAWVLLRKTHRWVGWPWICLPMIVLVFSWFPGWIRDLPEYTLPRMTLWLLAFASAAAVAFIIVLQMASRRLVATRDIRAWERLRTAQIGLPDSGIFWVAGVNNHDGRCDVLLEPFGADRQVSRSLWGTCEQGTWILVSSAPAIVGSAPNNSPALWERAAGL